MYLTTQSKLSEQKEKALVRFYSAPTLAHLLLRQRYLQVTDGKDLLQTRCMLFCYYLKLNENVSSLLHFLKNVEYRMQKVHIYVTEFYSLAGWEG